MSTTKNKYKTLEAVFNKTRKQLVKKIEDLQALMDSNPYLDLLDLQNELRIKMAANLSGDLPAPELSAWLNEAAPKEKRLMQEIKKQKDYSKLIDTKLDLEDELQALDSLWMNVRIKMPASARRMPEPPRYSSVNCPNQGYFQPPLIGYELYGSEETAEK